MALPRYQNIGITAGGGVGPIDFPNRGEATRGYDALSSALNTMSEAFFGEARIAATEEGKKYGAEMAPTQEQIKLAMETGQPIAPVGDSRTYFGKAAQATAAQIGAINVEARAKMDLDEIKRGIQAGAISPGEVVPRVNSLTQGYSQALSQFDPVMAKRLEAELAKDGNTLFLAASARAAASAAAEAKQAVESIADSKLGLVGAIIEGGDVSFTDPETGNTITRSIKDRLSAEKAIFDQAISKLKPSEREKYETQWNKAAIEGVQLYVKRKSILDEDPTEARKRLESGEFDELLKESPLTKYALIESARTYENRLEVDRRNALKVEAASFKDNVNGTLKALRDGVTDVDLSFFSETRATKLLGDEAPSVIKQMQDAVRFNSAIQGLALLPPTDQAKVLSEARARIPKGGADYDERRDEAVAIERAINTNRERLTKDSASYVLQSPQVGTAYNRMVEIARDPAATPEQRQRAASEYAALSIGMQESLGVDRSQVKVLPDDYVKALAVRYNDQSANPEGMVAFLQEQAAIWGPTWPVVERQLAGQLPSTINVAANLTNFGQRVAAETLIKATREDQQKKTESILPSDAKKTISENVTSGMTDFYRSLDLVNGGIKQKSDYTKAAEEIAKYYVASAGMAPVDAARKAVSDVIDGAYNFISTDRDTIRIPKNVEGLDGMALNVVKTRNSLQRFEFAIPASVGNLSEDERKRQYYDSLKFSGRFVTNPDETGVRLYDATGSVVLGKDGKPYNWTWAQLQEEVYVTTVPYRGLVVRPKKKAE